jgi:hypothetical protein
VKALIDNENVSKNETFRKVTYRDLLRVLFSHAPPGQYLEVRQLRQKRKPDQKWIPVSKLANLHITQKRGYNVYFGICPRIESGYGGADNVGWAACIWADPDNGTTPEDWQRKGIDPSIILGSSPGKYQIFMLLDQPTTDLDTIEELNARLQQVVKGDTVWNRDRIFRLPGFPNLKYPDKPLAVIRKLDSNRRFTLEELDQILPELEEPIQHRGQRSRGGGRGRGRLEARSQEAQAYFAALWKRGYGLELRQGDWFYYCVNHESKSKKDDLKVDSEACVYHCFGCGFGGGLRDLEAIVQDKERGQKFSKNGHFEGVTSSQYEGKNQYHETVTPPKTPILENFFLPDALIAWEHQQSATGWLLENAAGTAEEQMERCLQRLWLYQCLTHEDDKTLGYHPCPVPYCNKHDTRTIYHLEHSPDRTEGYPGLREVSPSLAVSGSSPGKSPGRAFVPVTGWGRQEIA